MADHYYNLLPCPFCGCDQDSPIESVVHLSGTGESDEPDYTVQCDGCAATMGYSWTEEEAVAAWNCRVAPKAEAAAPEGARPNWLDTHCQSGRADVCRASQRDGIVCPDDSCDIDDGVRPRDPAPEGAQPTRPYVSFDAGGVKVDLARYLKTPEGQAAVRSASGSGMAEGAQGAVAIGRVCYAPDRNGCSRWHFWPEQSAHDHVDTLPWDDGAQASKVFTVYTTQPQDTARDQEDAERYRWLRDKANDARRSAPMVMADPLDKAAQRLIHGEELDAAIDAARGAGGEGRTNG